MHLVKYILRRLLALIPVLLGVVFIVFTINQLSPGDPVVGLLGSNYTEEQYQAKEAELGLDKPFLVQFFNYVKGIVTKLDFGTSFQTKRPVTTEILGRFPVTLMLGFIGVLITVIVGVPFGIISATKQYSPIDYGVTIVSLFFASMPNFWMGLMMIIIFSLNLKWLPATGLDTWKHWILPALAIGLPPVATVTRITRSSMLDVIRQDYIRTARSKGLNERAVIMRHALRNAIIPVVTVIGMQMGLIMGGSVVIEAIFAIPGLGSLLMSAINNKDYPLIQGIVLFLSLSIGLMNLLVDIIYGVIDPRIKSQYGVTKRKILKDTMVAAAKPRKEVA